MIGQIPLHMPKGFNCPATGRTPKYLVLLLKRPLQRADDHTLLFK